MKKSKKSNSDPLDFCPLVKAQKAKQRKKQISASRIALTVGAVLVAFGIGSVLSQKLVTNIERGQQLKAQIHALNS